MQFLMFLTDLIRFLGHATQNTETRQKSAKNIRQAHLGHREGQVGQTCPRGSTLGQKSAKYNVPPFPCCGIVAVGAWQLVFVVCHTHLVVPRARAWQFVFGSSPSVQVVPRASAWQFRRRRCKLFRGPVHSSFLICLFVFVVCICPGLLPLRCKLFQLGPN